MVLTGVISIMPKKDQLEPDKIKTGHWIGNKVLVYRQTSSTNDIAAEYGRSDGNDGLAVFAEEQSAGRGRAGTKWFSPGGQSILCSILLTDYKGGAELLSLTSAVATAEAIDKPGDKQARIKWPNDVRLGDKKVAGILVESRRRRMLNGSKIYILGVGINCHQSRDSFPPDIRQQATSIDMESGSRVDRNILSRRLLDSFDNWLKISETGSEQVTQRWRELSVQLGHRVRLIFNGREFAGNCIGIDPEKGLIVQLDRGGVRMFGAAHTRTVGAPDSLI